MELYWKRNVDPSRSQCLKIVNGKSSSAVIFQCYFLFGRKMHISAQVIESYPRKYVSWSCGEEKLSIPLEAHHKAWLSEIFLSFHAKKLRAVILSFGQSCWKGIFKLPRSRAFQQCTTCPSVAKKSCGSHLFGVGPGEADETALVQELSKAITFLS